MKIEWLAPSGLPATRADHFACNTSPSRKTTTAAMCLPVVRREPHLDGIEFRKDFMHESEKLVRLRRDSEAPPAFELEAKESFDCVDAARTLNRDPCRGSATQVASHLAIGGALDSLDGARQIERPALEVIEYVPRIGCGDAADLKPGLRGEVRQAGHQRIERRVVDGQRRTKIRKWQRD